MADEIPPAPSESEDASKAETIRITLPPKQEQQAVKRETVRINLPGRSPSPVGTTPKKETTKLPSGAALEAPSAPAAPSAPSFPKPPSAPSIPPPPSAPPSGGPKPFVPPPPKPLGSGSGMTPSPGGILKPSGVTPPPKPPSLGPSKPTVPLKPVPPPPSGAGATPAPGLAPTLRAAAPKKETARITLPPEGASKPSLPKATVKMGQTQPLANRPAATGVASAAHATVPALGAGGASASDGMATILSLAALLISAVALVTVYIAFSAAS